MEEKVKKPHADEAAMIQRYPMPVKWATRGAMKSSDVSIWLTLVDISRRTGRASFPATAEDLSKMTGAHPATVFKSINNLIRDGLLVREGIRSAPMLSIHGPQAADSWSKVFLYDAWEELLTKRYSKEADQKINLPEDHRTLLGRIGDLWGATTIEVYEAMVLYFEDDEPKRTWHSVGQFAESAPQYLFKIGWRRPGCW